MFTEGLDGSWSRGWGRRFWASAALDCRGEAADRGPSRRRSVLIVKVILERIIRALKRGWDMESSLGKLRRVKRHFSKFWDAIDDWPANRDPQMIVHELDEAGDRELHPGAWPKSGAADARSQRSVKSSSRARRKSTEVNAM